MKPDFLERAAWMKGRLHYHPGLRRGASGWSESARLGCFCSSGRANVEQLMGRRGHRQSESLKHRCWEPTRELLLQVESRHAVDNGLTLVELDATRTPAMIDV